MGRAALDPTATVPGAARSDLWNSLWSLWFVADSVGSGAWPWHTDLLNHPRGGVLWVADPLGALVALPLVPLLGVVLAYNVLVWLRLLGAGLVAHLFARDLVAAHGGGEGSRLSPWIAGAGYMTAPVLISGLHNGTSEATAYVPVVLAAWLSWRVAQGAGAGTALLAALCLGLSTLASGYSAVVAFLFAGSVCVLGVGVPHTRLRRASVLLLGLLVAVPIAAAVSYAATAPDNLVGIKDPRQVAGIRRSTGPADPLTFFVGLGYRSPDFRVLNRYGEDFVHCAYLPYTLWVPAVLGLWRQRGARRALGWLALAGVVGLVLAMGPVIVRNGHAWVFLDDRAMPLPYLLLEGLPGFGSLSLLWRLGQAPILAVALLAAVAASSLRPRVVALLLVAVLMEARLVSSTGFLPATTPAQVHPAIEALAEAPPGAVLNHPVVGGQAYLHEQTAHGHPLAGRLNFPNNSAGMALWQELRETDRDARKYRAAVSARAEALGVRYLVVHLEPGARPDMHDDAVSHVARVFTPMSPKEAAASSGPHARAVRIYRFY